MAIYKCKMCGGDLQIEEGVTVCECEYCGSKQTVPTADNEKKMTLFTRANRLRANNEFDKAYSIYEAIVAEFPEEAEAYWGLILCKYGIEYVDDPTDGRKVPTCHRSSFDSLMDDSDFEMVMEYSDSVAKRVYREQAKEIEELRKEIIEVSDKEEPYDIFICYKETAEDGQRTIDSVIAQDVYDALIEKGYRVFFSRISLEDKLGTEYEPYIFAALNSAKIMLAFGTDYDYYNAVWVKNEWSRFLMLMAKDKTKHLIPCYKGIDAYDIPKEFAKLQAQDMGKVGAIQDLLRGIDKLTGRDEKKTAGQSGNIVTAQTIVLSGPSVNSLIDRGNMALEEGGFETAKGFFDRALDIDSKSVEAFLGLFMVEIESRDKVEAARKFTVEDLSQNGNWKRVKQFATGEMKTLVEEWEQKRENYLVEEAEKEKAEFEKQKKEEAKKKEEFKKKLEQFKQEEEHELDKSLPQLKTENRKISNLQQEIDNMNHILQNLDKQITEKETYLGTLGIFKGKEKKEVQDQIERLVYEKEKTEKEKISKEAERAQEMEILVKLNNQIENVKERFGKEFNKLRKEYIDVVIEFGRNPEDSKPIEWIVLESSNKGILILSKYALKQIKYNEEKEAVTWEKCSLRNWLNNEFLETAFNKDEKEKVLKAEVRNENNQRFKNNTDSGSGTADRVFLLSIHEVKEFFESDIERTALYSKGNHAFWWLRSQGKDVNRAALVGTDGTIYEHGREVNYFMGAARPALWIDFDFFINSL